MNIDFFNEEVSLPELNFVQIAKWLQDVIESNLKSCGPISIIFCSDEYILKINREYLKHDYYTDIITFNYSSSKMISGDLFISTETVLSNSKQFSETFQNEFCRVMVHGILHLLGWNDATSSEKEEMKSQENFFLKKLQIP